MMYIYICMFLAYIYIQMYFYMATYGHIYSYMHYFSTQEVCKPSLQCIYNQEAGVLYTKLIQLQCSATYLPCRGL